MMGPTSVRFARKSRMLRGLSSPTTLFALTLCALVSALVWNACNEKVEVPDFHGAVSGLAFAPYQRGQSPEDGKGPTASQIRGDLERAAEMTGRVRTYTVQGVLASIPSLAEDLPLSITLGAWLDRNQTANGDEIRRLISVARANSNVERVLVGNELLLRGRSHLGTAHRLHSSGQARRSRTGFNRRAVARLAGASRTGAGRRLHHHPSAAVLGRAADRRRAALRHGKARRGAGRLSGQADRHRRGRLALERRRHRRRARRPRQPGDVPAQVLHRGRQARPRLFRHGSVRPAVEDELRRPRRRLLGNDGPRPPGEMEHDRLGDARPPAGPAGPPPASLAPRCSPGCCCRAGPTSDCRASCSLPVWRKCSAPRSPRCCSP